MSQTRQRRHVRTKQAILDAALEIVIQDGPAALSMRSLAERIDYSPAGLYEYFGSKEEIIGAVCDEGQRMLYEAMEQADASLPPVEHLYHIGKAYIDFALEHPDYFLLMFTVVQPPDADNIPPEVMEQMMRGQGTAYGLLLQTIQRGIDLGVFTVRPGFGLDQMGYAAWSLVHGIAMLRITALRPYPIDLAAFDDEALRNFMRGLQAS
jgi:AcrR family transcriptional regulator